LHHYIVISSLVVYAIYLNYIILKIFNMRSV